jgi:predicted metal-dependent hydrolase
VTERRRRAPLPVEAWAPLEEAVSKDIFKTEVLAWVKRIRAEPKEIHVRPMRQKWGSCSTNGRVTFNAELLAESAAFRKRVIVEELLHLKVPNHGRLFRALLKAHLGRDVNAQQSTS